MRILSIIMLSLMLVNCAGGNVAKLSLENVAQLQTQKEILKLPTFGLLVKKA